MAAGLTAGESATDGISDKAWPTIQSAPSKIKPPANNIATRRPLRWSDFIVSRAER